MLQTETVALFLGSWASVYLIDVFLKNNHTVGHVYLNFLNRSGFSILILQLRWYTCAFNRWFVRLGQWRVQFWRRWFSAGVYFGVIAMIGSIIVLLIVVNNSLRQKSMEQQVLTPVMPGVNLPANQTVYYLLTLFICGILHEVGHAIAAVREQVHVNGFGIFVFGLYPGAFVDLRSDQLQAIQPLRQLRIYCAGVWHNFVIVIVAIILLSLLPWLLLPVYHTGYGVVVSSVQEHSAVSGPRGLLVGDYVVGLGNCRVNTVTDWVNCLMNIMEEKNGGFCMPVELVKQQDVSSFGIYPTTSGTIECCSNVSSTHVCFSYSQRGISQLQHACLPARSTSDRPSCYLQSDCYNPKDPSVCVIPALDNSTRLLRILHKRRAPTLFLGHPFDLHYSGALALLNVVPCYALDGQWILLALVEILLRPVITSSNKRTAIYSIILLFGTCLLGTTILIALWSLFT